ncbi:MAG: hypothetical protein V4439_04095 [Patescibacteria group bacterium]
MAEISSSSSKNSTVSWKCIDTQSNNLFICRTAVFNGKDGKQENDFFYMKPSGERHVTKGELTRFPNHPSGIMPYQGEWENAIHTWKKSDGVTPVKSREMTIGEETLAEELFLHLEENPYHGFTSDQMVTRRENILFPDGRPEKTA